ncbi:YjjG family noncanonical pyrimidine nucleotidase [Aureitalea marina]|uniref:Noncanonical pyrimidine nucleotidase, YjjG family n=1 Tax=Aureitalea marina TaxID=930804 RepID=A0A2S7KQT7_9FLAO|nr:YjjG family noncanonical pyrimidine nucleotidase [Aureitalea marina]PQB04958.1 noncanonical pyrimidine nucleotidase, YjjG family [Aureitalea marina]
MNKQAVAHIFFDLDHTIWDFDRNSALAFGRVFSTHRIQLEVARFVKIYEPINFNYWKLFREERISKQELRRGRFQDAFGALGMHFDITTIDLLAESYIQELPGDNHLFEGAEQLLERLADIYKLHIITNGFHQVQHQKLANSGIAHLFSTVTTSEEARVKKPHPYIFRLAMEKAGALPEESLMIGDTFEADILGAEEVGMQTIFINYHKENIPINYTCVDQLWELDAFL